MAGTKNCQHTCKTHKHDQSTIQQCKDNCHTKWHPKPPIPCRKGCLPRRPPIMPTIQPSNRTDVQTTMQNHTNPRPQNRNPKQQTCSQTIPVCRQCSSLPIRQGQHKITLQAPRQMVPSLRCKIQQRQNSHYSSRQC